MDPTASTSTLSSNPNHQILQFINCNIGLNRIIEIHYFEGESHIDIISYDKSPSGNYSKVSNKSIRLPLTLYRVLLDNLDSIKHHFKILQEGGQTDYKLHLGELTFLKIDRNVRCVDIRKHFVPVGSEYTLTNLRPGFPGVGMRIAEFSNFLNLLPQISNLSQADAIISCTNRQDHNLPENIENCKICNPHKLFF